MVMGSKRAAHFLGRYKGRRVHWYPVVVSVDGVSEQYTVDGVSAVGVARWVLEQNWRGWEVEVCVYGPRGSVTRRWSDRWGFGA